MWKKPKPHCKIAVHSWVQVHLGMKNSFLYFAHIPFPRISRISLSPQNSEIYSTPRLAESLENAVTFGSAGCITNANNIGTINSNNFNTSSTNGSSSLNNVHSQKHRIDALTSISTPVSGSTTIASNNGISSHSGLSQTMDTIVDAKLRQG